MQTYPSDYQHQFSESRRNIIRTIFSAMRTDYGQAFRSQFKKSPDGEDREPWLWGCRLLDLTQDYTDEQLVNGMDNACLKYRDFPPTIRQIQAEVQIVAFDEKRKAKARADLERAREHRDYDAMAKVANLASNLAATLKTTQTHTKPTAEETTAKFEAHKALVEDAARRGHEMATGKTMNDAAWLKHWREVPV